MKTLHTRYTKLGYACYLDDEQEPMYQGGNHPNCSETVLALPYAGENPVIRPMKLAEIKKVARQTHNGLRIELGYADGGLIHDRDDQDETLIMLGMGDHPSVSKRLRTSVRWDEKRAT